MSIGQRDGGSLCARECERAHTRGMNAEYRKTS